MPEAAIVSTARWPIGRDEGQLRVTASAAGRITALGSAIGSAKLGGFAGWCHSVADRHRRVGEHAIHPQRVKTPTVDQAGPVTELVSHHTALEAEPVAVTLWQAMQAGRLSVLPYRGVYGHYLAADNDLWLRGIMGQQRLDATAVRV